MIVMGIIIYSMGGSKGDETSTTGTSTISVKDAGISGSKMYLARYPFGTGCTISLVAGATFNYDGTYIVLTGVAAGNSTVQTLFNAQYSSLTFVGILSGASSKPAQFGFRNAVGADFIHLANDDGGTGDYAAYDNNTGTQIVALAGTNFNIEFTGKIQRVSNASTLFIVNGVTKHSATTHISTLFLPIQIFVGSDATSILKMKTFDFL